MFAFKWISYEELRKEYTESQLIELLHTGKLQPYDANNQPVYCPHDFHKYYHLFFKVSDSKERDTQLEQIVDRGWHEDENGKDKWSWEDVWVPDDTHKKAELFSILEKCKFRKDEIDNLSIPQQETLNTKQIDIDEIFKEAKKEILLVYHYFKKNNNDDISTLFDSGQVGTYLKSAYFEEGNIFYSYSTDKTKKRDIIGNILEKIALDHGIEINKQDMFKKHFTPSKKK